MKKLISILFTILFLTSYLGGNAQYDEATINKVRVKFETAKTYFASKKYSTALEKINEIETLMDGNRLASSQMLKVKILAEQKKFTKAKEELEILEGLELNDDIIKELAVYTEKIDNGVKKENALAEAYKHFTVKKCSNYDCKNGMVRKYRKVRCKKCGGDGVIYYSEYGMEGKCPSSFHGGCGGTGFDEEMDEKQCTSCNGKGKIYTYTGSYPFTRSEIDDYVRKNKSKIEAYNNSK